LRMNVRMIFSSSTTMTRLNLRSIAISFAD